MIYKRGAADCIVNMNTQCSVQVFPKNFIDEKNWEQVSLTEIIKVRSEPICDPNIFFDPEEYYEKFQSCEIKLVANHKLKQLFDTLFILLYFVKWHTCLVDALVSGQSQNLLLPIPS